MPATATTTPLQQRTPPVVRWLALLWLLFVLVLAASQWKFWQAPRLETDVFAALPHDGQAIFADDALQRLTQGNERRIVVLVGSADWARTRHAAQAFDAHIAQAAPHLLRRAQEQPDPSAALDFYAPWRAALLTPGQRELLAHSSEAALQNRAMQRLYGLGMAQPSGWLQDPLGLGTQWWSERASASPIRADNGLLRIDVPADAANTPAASYALLLYETVGAAFRFDGQPSLHAALQLARQKAEAAPAHADTPVTTAALQWHISGIALFAEAGAVQGHQEMNTIGWGSLAAVIALVCLAFMAMRPVLLIGLSLLIGCAAGLTATVWVFGHIHLLALVFGASLVGVAEDFGIHYFATRLGQPPDQGRNVAQRWLHLRTLLPSLAIALLTSVVAYAVLAIAPFPVLRQMAVFSAVGLAAAFFTVLCWFPLLDVAHLHEGPPARCIARSLHRLPILRSNAQMRWFLLAAALVCAGGIAQLRSNDDLRALQPAEPELLAQQQAVQRILAMPGMVQFFLVTGETPQQVLEREEALQDLLHQLGNQASAPVAVRLQAISQWLPSIKRQQENAALTARAESIAMAAVAHLLQEAALQPTAASPSPSESPEPLQLHAWLQSPVASAMRGQWLGRMQSGPHQGQYASAVLVQSANPAAPATATPAHLPALLQAVQQAQSQGQLPGVQWVDRVGELSALLGQYRLQMGWLLALGHAVVVLVLWARLGSSAWRAWLPCALASLLTLAWLGYSNQPVQLFHILALMLVLGMGVDYGIFLQESHDAPGHAWLAVLTGGISTMLSFGLLGLSSTPALQAFGQTLLMSLPASMALACLLRPGSGQLAAQ